MVTLVKKYTIPRKVLKESALWSDSIKKRKVDQSIDDRNNLWGHPLERQPSGAATQTLEISTCFLFFIRSISLLPINFLLFKRQRCLHFYLLLIADLSNTIFLSCHVFSRSSTSLTIAFLEGNTFFFHSLFSLIKSYWQIYRRQETIRVAFKNFLTTCKYRLQSITFFSICEKYFLDTTVFFNKHFFAFFTLKKKNTF